MSIVVLLAVAAAAFFGAQWVDRHLTVDRPIGAEIARAWQEIAAPRPDIESRPTTVSARVAVNRWRGGARPPRRWWEGAAETASGGARRHAAKLLRRPMGRVYVEGGWRDVR